MLPDDPTFAPGGKAWTLGDDYIEQTLDDEAAKALVTLNRMITEMLTHGADEADVDAWVGILDSQIEDQRRLQ